MRIICITDCHFYAPHALKIQDLSSGLMKYGPGVVYLGDNYDIRNTKKSVLPAVQDELEKFIKKCNETGTTYVDGNHELRPFSNHYFQAIRLDEGRRVLLTHGDFVAYGSIKKCKKWRNKKPGISSFRWYLQKLFIGKRKGSKKELKEKYLKRAAQLARSNDCTIIVIGHFHMKEIYETSYEGIKIIALPRGESLVTL